MIKYRGIKGIDDIDLYQLTTIISNCLNKYNINDLDLEKSDNVKYEIYLYGSAIRNEMTDNSDIDIYIRLNVRKPESKLAYIISKDIESNFDIIRIGIVGSDIKPFDAIKLF